MKRVGYARVSTKEQNLNLQIDALKKANCTRIYQEKESGLKKRKVLENAIRALKPGDELVVWKTDRLGRDFIQLYRIFKRIKKKGAHLFIIYDRMDACSGYGKRHFLTEALRAEIERDDISERTVAGLQAAKERGKKLGRPRGITLDTMKKAEEACYLYRQGYKTIKEICKEVDISKGSFYKYLKQQQTPLRYNNI